LHARAMRSKSDECGSFVNIPKRKCGRVVEGTSLENWRRFIPFVSSNLTASAKYPA
jgi:hypothetical protein